MMRLQILLLISLLFLPIAYLHAEQEAYQPNTGSSSAYPSAEDYSDKPGTGKATEFDIETGESQIVYDSNNAVYTTYPKAVVVAEVGTGKPTTFNSGTAEYPSDYHNPLDSKPMVINDEEEKSEAEPPDEPPADTCPLGPARKQFRQYNHFQRKEILTAFSMSGDTGIIQTRRRDMSQPARLGDYELSHASFDPKTKKWSAVISVPAGQVCDPGNYRVEVDDGIAPDAQILAIRDTTVLLSIEDELAYMTTAKQKPIQWRMVWDSGIEVEFESTAPEMKDKIKKGKDAPKRKYRKSKRKKRNRKKKRKK